MNNELSQKEMRILSYTSWARTLTFEQLEAEIENLKSEAQGNAEMSESAHYHRNEGSNMFLADWQDYEAEYEKCQTYITICYAVLEEKMKK